MPTADIKNLRTDLARSSSSGHFAKLREYAKLDWEPWTQDGPTDALFPSDERMCAAADHLRGDGGDRQPSSKRSQRFQLFRA
jgi:hypothetical protein